MKGNKEDDDKMRTTAANVAARAAVGGDDAFLKWQLMAEARQKSVSEAGKDGNQKATSGGGRNSKDRQDGGRRFSGTGESILFTAFCTSEMKSNRRSSLLKSNKNPNCFPWQS